MNERACYAAYEGYTLHSIYIHNCQFSDSHICGASRPTFLSRRSAALHDSPRASPHLQARRHTYIDHTTSAVVTARSAARRCTDHPLSHPRAWRPDRRRAHQRPTLCATRPPAKPQPRHDGVPTACASSCSSHVRNAKTRGAPTSRQIRQRAPRTHHHHLAGATLARTCARRRLSPERGIGDPASAPRFAQDPLPRSLRHTHALTRHTYGQHAASSPNNVLVTRGTSARPAAPPPPPRSPLPAQHRVRARRTATRSIPPLLRRRAARSPRCHGRRRRASRRPRRTWRPRSPWRSRVSSGRRRGGT